METVAENGVYSWQDGGASGSFRIGGKFTSASQSVCRRYAENYNIRSIRGITGGYGCRRSGDGGWCQLAENAGVLTCALAPPNNSFDSVMRRGSDFIGDLISGAQNLR